MSTTKVEAQGRACAHGHTVRKVGCVSCVLVFDRETIPAPVPQQHPARALLRQWLAEDAANPVHPWYQPQGRSQWEEM